MARCDEGYRCEVCGQDVEQITDSDLYLRYILDEIPLEFLHRAAERHIRCNPVLAQYIRHERFEPVTLEGPFGKQQFDPAFRVAEEQRVTQGWLRLQAIPRLGLSVAEYPLAITPFSRLDEPGSLHAQPNAQPD
ncbi:MAG: hypothetical protein LC104_12880 [Bacteroidales bacterium]|nr:hypothetical protein [Bacteroidales bacterium]